MATRRGSILLVDDEEKILKALGRALREAGHQRLGTHEPVDAAAQAARHRGAVEGRLRQHQRVRIELVQVRVVPCRSLKLPSTFRFAQWAFS